jgi:Ricin-type beta-trefoil lectin domain-like
MKRLIWFSVILAIALSVMPAAPAKAGVASLDIPGVLHDTMIYNLGSGYCIEPVPEAPDNGLDIAQYPCSVPVNDWQRWRVLFLKSVNGVYIYRIMNWRTYLLRSDQCLDDRDGNPANDAPVQQWACNTTSTTMQWKMEQIGNWGFQFRNVRSGKCLEVHRGSLQPGARLTLYRCTSTASSPNWGQLFFFHDPYFFPY